MTTSPSRVSDLQRFNLGYGARVSAEFGLEAYDDAGVVVRTQRNNGWQVEMTPYQAKKLARQLTRIANIIEPPKKRK
jgi:hypothetical protein